MPVTVISNKPRTSVVLHVTGPTTSINITGNTAVSNIASPGEVLTGAFITQAAWGIDPTGYIVIKRGGTLVAVYDSTGQHEYAGCGMPIKAGETAANLAVEFIGSSNGFITFELQKLGAFAASEYFQN
jgi:hypothetical protein